MIEPYTAAMAQPMTQCAFGDDGALIPEIMDRNVQHCCDLIQQAATEHGARLVAFPQFALTGYGAATRSKHWIEGSAPFPNRELETLGAAARRAKAFVVVQLSESHPSFPGRYFLSSVLIDDDGEVAAIYRKHYSLSLRTSPIDVFDRFVEVFGEDALFSVAQTKIGAIGMCIGAEVNWPEVVRTLTLKGAEIIVNPVCAPSPSLDYVDRMASTLVRPVRAFENQIYLGMANSAPRKPQDTPSEIYDFNGELIGRAGYCETFALATFDVDALRAARERPHINYVAQLQPVIHPDLQTFPHWPANAFSDQAASSFETLYAVESDVWRRLQEGARSTKSSS